MKARGVTDGTASRLAGATAIDIDAVAGGLAVRGDLNARTVRALYEQTSRFSEFSTEFSAKSADSADSAAELRIDLAAVGDADGAGLALLAHWRHGAASGVVRFANPSAQLRRLAAISGVADLFD